MVWLFDSIKFWFTKKKRKQTLKNKGYIWWSDGNIYKSTGFWLEKVGTKKSWF